MWGSCLYAAVRGGRSERIVAISFLVATGLSELAVSPYGVRYRHVETGLVLIDLTVFAIFFGVGLFSRKFWPLWITAMQGVALLAHFSPLMPLIVPQAYGNAIALWSWPMMVLLALATYRHRQEKVIATRSPG